MLKLTIDEREFRLCNDWQEVTFGQYIDIISIQKDGFSSIETAVKLFAAISDKPKECEQALYSLSKEDFEELNSVFDFTVPDFKSYSATTEFISIDGKNYRMKSDFDRLTMGEMASMEILFANNKELDPNEIAFGVLLRELDAEGKEKTFSDETFFEVVNNLRDKVLLRDVYQHLLFFSSGERKSSRNTRGFSIQTESTPRV